MTRLLLILAITLTGLAPSAGCWFAVSAQAVAAQASSCEMTCCGTTCCCVTDTQHIPVPDTPATPPRGSDVVPLTLLFASPVVWAWEDERSFYPAHDAGYADRIISDPPRAVQPLICRWVT